VPRKKHAPGIAGFKKQSPIFNVGKSPLLDFRKSALFNVQTSPFFNIDTSTLLKFDASPLLKFDTSPLLSFGKSPLLDLTNATPIRNDFALKLPNIATLDQIQASLTFPTTQVFNLASAVLEEFPEVDAAALSDFEDELSGSDTDEAPELLSDRLLWMPEIRQRRVFLAAVWALKELVDFVDLESGVVPPGHVLQLVSLLWAIAAALSEWIELEKPKS
jgi:hypothetical protein